VLAILWDIKTPHIHQISRHQTQHVHNVNPFHIITHIVIYNPRNENIKKDSQSVEKILSLRLSIFPPDFTTTQKQENGKVFSFLCGKYL
jgi:hypothetical protein